MINLSGQRVLRFILLASFLATSAAGEAKVKDKKSKHRIYMVAHPKTDIETISVATVRNIYLGMKAYWERNTRIIPIIRPNKVRAGNLFFKWVLRMVPSRYRHHWQSLELSGRGIAPESIADPARVGILVSARVGAIAFVLDTELPMIEKYQLVIVPLELIMNQK